MSVNTYTPGSTRPLVIYHGNCADGFSAAWCFWDAYKDGYEYYPGEYQKAPPDVTGRVVYLVDFSYKSFVIEQMLETAQCIIVIDHHKSAIEDLEAFEKYIEKHLSNLYHRVHKSEDDLYESKKVILIFLFVLLIIGIILLLNTILLYIIHLIISGFFTIRLPLFIQAIPKFLFGFLQ